MTQSIVVNLINELDTALPLPDEATIQGWAQAAFNAAGYNKDCSFSLTFTDDVHVQEFNRTYRHIDKPTNILSFPFAEGEDDLMADLPPECREELEGELDGEIGDLIVSYETMEREAKEQQKSLQEHLAHLIIHGCLHLIGYDHIQDDEAEIMEGLEIKALAALGYRNPYLTQDELN